jgi:hypothetical protein
MVALVESETRLLEWELAAVCNDNLLGRLARRRSQALNLRDNVHASRDLAKHHVLACWIRMTWLLRYKPSSHDVVTVVMKNWEPLVSLPALAMERRPGPVCLLGMCECNAQYNHNSQLEVLVGKLGAVDGLATGAVTICEVTLSLSQNRFYDEHQPLAA